MPKYNASMNRSRALLALITLAVLAAAAAGQAPPSKPVNDLPALAADWTELEKTQFRNCVFLISDSKRENATQLNTDVGACLFFGERQHWLDLHPQAALRKEDGDKTRKCFEKHPLPKEGAPEEFYAVFDFCMCKGFGLPKPKQ